MLTRIISSVIMIILLLTVLYTDLVIGIPLINFTLALLILAALYEVYKPFGFLKRVPLAVLGFTLGILLAFGKLTSAGFVVVTICFYMLLMFICAVCYHKTIKFSDIAILLFTTLYISLGLAHARLIIESLHGVHLLFVVLIGAFMTDTGAYFFGRFFGKHKLIPEISPKKTVEGAVGGVITALISFGIYTLIVKYCCPPLRVNIPHLLLVGLITSVMSQFGDLSASMIKRELNLKDYGEIIQGHGGVLDRLDSLIFAAPVVYYLNILFPVLIG